MVYDEATLATFTPTSNDLLGLAGYEAFYNAPYPVGVDANGNTKNHNKLDFTICAPSDVNPDFSPVLRYVARGDTVSSTNTNNMLIDYAFTDGTTQTEVASGTASTITLTTL